MHLLPSVSAAAAADHPHHPHHAHHAHAHAQAASASAAAAAAHHFKMSTAMEERLSHGISSSGFPGGHNRSDFQPPYFPPPFPQQTAEQVFAAQAPHLSVGDPYSLNNSLHFQTSQANMHAAAFSYDRRVGSVPTDPYTRLPLDTAGQDGSIVAGTNVNNNDHVSLF